ncbi:MAG: ATP-binding protein [Gammaproteobacteria bacterium]|jgi:signal transduction histidine kinase/ActR/RegA family two-component response regulator
MRLRTQILLVLLSFALLPLLVTIATNFPRVLQLLNSFQQELYLQDLRADFTDLDQYLVSRQEMLKLLAKLPEPGLVLGKENVEDQSAIDLARTYYTEWINRILPDQIDIIEILFIDAQARLRFWLERDADTFAWHPTLKAPVLPVNKLLQQTLNTRAPEVFLSPVRIMPEQKTQDPRRFMNLHLTGPLGRSSSNDVIGAVIMTVDIGGMARRFDRTFWTYDDGRYLEASKRGDSTSTAFRDYPGLEEPFKEGKTFLWKGQDNERIIWVPLIQTESSGPIWVGRIVDDSPLVDFTSQLIIQVFSFMLVLMLIAWVVARWLAIQADKVGYQLTDGISRMLEDDEKVVFNWRWTQELKSLSEKLTRLANKHAANNQRLRSHTRELEESNRYKSEFLANVSHELRTPLNSILLLSKILADRDSGLSSENLKQAQVIHKAGRDLQQLIENILDLSKIEAGHSALNLENVVLSDLIEEMVQLLKPQFDDKGLYLKTHYETDKKVILNTDPDKLKQIIKNFLSNAVKFTEKGGVVISISKHEDADDSTLPINISVKDTGIGIPRNKQKLVFQAFKQVDGSTSRRYGGTGLGLSISNELAQLLGGKIMLKSEEAKGAEFILELPLVFDRSNINEEQLGVDEPAVDIAAVNQAGAEKTFIDCNVLILEKDMQNLLALTTLLEKWNITVTGAGDVEEALEVLAEESFSLMILDAMISTSEDNAAIRRVRSSYGCEDLPMVVLTSRHDEKQKQACIEGGASEYLLKPVEPSELNSILQKYITVKESAQE